MENQDKHYSIASKAWTAAKASTRPAGPDLPAALAAGVVAMVVAAAAGDGTPVVVPFRVEFAVAATALAVEVMVTANRVIWSQATVEVLVPGVPAVPVTVSVQV